ncbi:MAG: hypothetical protein EOO57_14060 [Hymenobacter sp.]|nr:MAG: hypothetical protein EOO57_14060 [Hymenobacter sp.]
MKKAAIFLMLLSSCQNKLDCLERGLTAKTNYWLYLRPGSIGHGIDTTYLPVAKFSTDNTYKSVLLENGKTKAMLPNVDGPTTEGGTWKYNAVDSTITIDENTFKIKNLKKDTIFLVSNSGDTHLLVKKFLSHPTL